MKHRVRHDLGTDQAKKVAEAALKTYAERFSKYNPTYSWASDSQASIGFSAKGVNLTGSLEVLSDGYDLDLDVPFLLRPFKGKAIGIIEEEIQKWIAKSKAGEL